MPENRWYIESKMREMSPKRVTLSALHGFRLSLVSEYHLHCAYDFFF